MSYFVALDGEEIDGKYALLQDSHEGIIYRPAGIHTLEVFEWLLGRSAALPGVIFVGFGLVYDWNHWMANLPPGIIQMLVQRKEKDPVLWKVDETTEYEMLYIPRKIFKLTRYRKTGVARATKDAIVIYDVLSFFQKSFVKVVEGFLGEKASTLLTEYKAKRGAFTTADIVEIERYNVEECKLLVRVMEKLRSMFIQNKIFLTAWHGPGAVANALLKKTNGGCNIAEDIPRYNPNATPIGLLKAWDCAYFGGRIENTIVGTVKDVWNYDINSAYPYAASTLPRIADPYDWDRIKIDDSTFWKSEMFPDMSVWLCEWSLPQSTFLGPFPWRHRSGRIYFPSNGIGWYWKPEVEEARRKYGDRIIIHEGWSNSDDRESILQTVIPELYLKRKRMKASKDSAEFVIKLALNSLYGKFAQRQGKRQYYCLPYAGYITSKTRAILSSATANPKDILAYSTDGILSRKRLDLPLGEGLGQWKETHHKSVTILMNGFYRLESDNGTMQNAIAHRGIGGKIDWDSVISQLTKKGKAIFKSQIFVTHSIADNFRKKYSHNRLQFVPSQKELDPFSPGKRVWKDTGFRDWESGACESTLPTVTHTLSFPSSLNTESPELQQKIDERELDYESDEAIECRSVEK